MQKGKIMVAVCLAVLLTCVSLAAEAAVRLVDRDAGRRSQAIIDSAGWEDGGSCESCNGTEGGDSENVIIFE